MAAPRAHACQVEVATSEGSEGANTTSEASVLSSTMVNVTVKVPSGCLLRWMRIV